MELSGAWRSLVAHLYGVQVVAGSNPVAPMVRSMALQSPSHGVLQGYRSLGGRWVTSVSKTPHGSAGTDEILTVKEIEARYPSEWVLIEDPEVDEQLDVIRGTVPACWSIGSRHLGSSAPVFRSSVTHFRHLPLLMACSAWISFGISSSRSTSGAASSPSHDSAAGRVGAQRSMVAHLYGVQVV